MKLFTTAIRKSALLAATLFPLGLLAQFNLLTPPSGTSLNVEGLGSSPVNITWEADATLMGSVTYTWHLDLPGNNFTNPIVSVPSNNAGADTELDLTLSTINSLLASQGLSIGQSVNLIWTVTATDGMTTNFAAQPFDLTLTRGAVADAFDLSGPADQTALTVEGNASNTITINWRSAGEGVTYAWLLDASGNDFSNPIVKVPSNNMGMDTALTLNLGTVEAVLEGAGVTQGNSANLIWRVHAYAANDSLPSNQTFDIDLTNGAVAKPFELAFPADDFTAIIPDDAAQYITITLEGSGEGVTYAWLLDAVGNDFSNPIVQVASNNSGADTALTLDFATIHAVLTSAGVNPGDTANLIWRVHAYSGNDSLPSNSDFSINLAHGIGTSIQSTSTLSVKVYPNPVAAGNTIRIDGLEQKGEIAVVDLSGRTIANYDSVQVIPTAGLQPGVYLLKIQHGNTRTFKRVTIQ